MTTFCSLCALAGLIIQGAMYRWSFTRGNRRVALRVLHVFSFGALALLLLHAYTVSG